MMIRYILALITVISANIAVAMFDVGALLHQVQLKLEEPTQQLQDLLEQYWKLSSFIPHTNEYLQAHYAFENRLAQLVHASVNVNVKSNSGNTALMVAAIYDYPEIVKVLLDKGANVNIQDNFGNTALMIAIRYNRPEIVQMLLKADADQTLITFNNKTALDLAKEIGDQKIIKLLHENQKKRIL